MRASRATTRRASSSALLLKDEEEHVDWLEAQLHQIKEMGYETYLSNLTEGKEG